MFLSRQLAKQSQGLPLGLCFNSYSMPISHKQGHCAAVCTPDGFAMKARSERLRRELRNNLKGAK